MSVCSFGFVLQPYFKWFQKATFLSRIQDMAKTRFDDSNCAVARALNEVGDWWSLLIVLQAMYGTRRFVDFQQELGIAKNILCNRLERLVENEVLRKEEVGEHGSRKEYRLTEKGRDLFPVVIALRQWADKWNPVPGGDGLDIRDKHLGKPLAAVQVCNAEGEVLSVRDVYAEAPTSDPSESLPKANE